MNEWINSKDLLPPIGQPVVVRGNKKNKPIIATLLLILSTNIDCQIGETIEEMQLSEFHWTSLPEHIK